MVSFLDLLTIHQLLDILVPLLHEPLARGCETVSVTLLSSTTALPVPDRWFSEPVNKEVAANVLSVLEGVGRIIQERTIGVPWTRLALTIPTPLPVEFQRKIGSNDWTLSSETYDSSVKKAIEAKYGSSGIRFSTKEGTSTAPRVCVGQWGRKYFTTYHDVIPHEECLRRHDGRMRLEGDDE